MAIPSRPIGQSAEADLLWNISKQLEQLIGQVGAVVKNTAPITTTTTTTIAAPTQYDETYATSGSNACNYNFAGAITLYSASSTLDQGVSVFTDITLTTPFTEGYVIFRGASQSFVAGPNGVLAYFNC